MQSKTGLAPVTRPAPISTLLSCLVLSAWYATTDWSAARQPATPCLAATCCVLFSCRRSLTPHPPPLNLANIRSVRVLRTPVVISSAYNSTRTITVYNLLAYYTDLPQPDMETAPLTKAFDYAKASAHVFAAGEFANASKHTTSAEALRTLKLLEEHHRRIAELLKIAPDHQSQQQEASPLYTHSEPNSGNGIHGDEAADSNATIPSSSSSADAATAAAAASAHATSDATAASITASTPRRGQPPQLSPSTSNVGSTSKAPALASSLAQKRMIPPQRDLTSSIASNLATARGIRASAGTSSASRQRGRALTPSVSNDQAPGNFDVPPRVTDLNAWPKPHGGNDATTVGGRRPGLNTEGSEKHSTNIPKQDQGSEEGYSRFYSTFGSIISRISAPLAFAGLPLISEESGSSHDSNSNSSIGDIASFQPEPASNPSSGNSRRVRLSHTHSTTAEPELSKIYSKATLRAISRDMAPADSFYVVPTSGHTVSYANILTFAEKEKRRMEASIFRTGDENEADDDFVDARETLPPYAHADSLAGSNAPLSDGAKKRVGRARSEKDLTNTIEELYLENRSLKDALDNLSKRLHAFEASAQNSHMALAESMRFMRPGSPVSTGSGGGKDDSSGAGLHKKIQELEEQLALVMRDNEKKQKTLVKYREKWELLKAGAKARREAQGTVEPTEE